VVVASNHSPITTHNSPLTKTGLQLLPSVRLGFFNFRNGSGDRFGRTGRIVRSRGATAATATATAAAAVATEVIHIVAAIADAMGGAASHHQAQKANRQK
jgi:hypothetical protein